MYGNGWTFDGLLLHVCKGNLFDAYHRLNDAKMSCIFQLELQCLDRHAARVQRTQRTLNAARQKTNEQRKRRKKQVRSSKKEFPPKELKDSSHVSQLKQTQYQQPPQSDASQERADIPILFLPPSTSPSVLKLQSLKLIQANTVITSMIASIALQKLQLQQKILNLRRQLGASTSPSAIHSL